MYILIIAGRDQCDAILSEAASKVARAPEKRLSSGKDSEVEKTRVSAVPPLLLAELNLRLQLLLKSKQ